MKNLSEVFSLSLCLLVLAFVGPTILSAQSNSTSTEELDGDHFDLAGALELFKTAKSPEAFEQSLNKNNNKVNNLDLNEDGEVDYIRVEDHQEESLHAIVIQALVSEKEVQDIAVIEIEKTGNEEATLQILGDETVFGEQVIIEPTEVSNQMSPNGKGGPSADIHTQRIIVNVWAWPSVRFVYRPGYRRYVSPYRWRVYPRYYRPWRPLNVVAFRSVIVPRPHFQVVRTHRVVNAHRVYTPVRRSSVVVRQRTTTRMAARPNTRTRTTTVGVKKNNGNVVGAKRTTTRTRGNTRNGKVGVTKSTTVTKGKNKNGTTVRKKTTTTKVRKR